MNKQRFLIAKTRLIHQLDFVRNHIENISVEDACKCCQKYQGEDDPMGVVFHELFYSHVINMYNNISDIS